MKDFIPYNESLELKELGFDEESFGLFPRSTGFILKWIPNQQECEEYFGGILAPTFSQAFRFFREKHGYFTSPTQYDDDVIKKYDWHITKNLGDGRLLIEFVGYHNTYEEAELACLQKLITLVKNGK
jgi:hypothetical protein